MIKKIFSALLLSVAAFATIESSAQTIADFPAPLFADPHYTGSCDPEIVWNEALNEWNIFYTGRRPAKGIGSTCGNPIGVASSKDLKHWEFKGYCKFDGKGGEPDSEQTFWAPGVIIDGKKAHMYVTFKPDSVAPWGTGGCIAHYEAPADDIVNGWVRKEVSIGEDNCLDASLVKVGRNDFRMYYVGGIDNEGAGKKGRKTIRYAESRNLNDWSVKGNVLGDVNDQSKTKIHYQEGVYVFMVDDYFYMVADPHKGFSSYSSPDGVTWKYHGQIMKGGESKRNLDWSQARHPSVITKDGNTYIFYHVEPFRPDGARNGDLGRYQRYAFVQVAQLKCSPENGIEVIRE